MLIFEHYIVGYIMQILTNPCNSQTENGSSSNICVSDAKFWESLNLGIGREHTPQLFSYINSNLKV